MIQKNFTCVYNNNQPYTSTGVYKQRSILKSLSHYIAGVDDYYMSRRNVVISSVTINDYSIVVEIGVTSTLSDIDISKIKTHVMAYLKWYSDINNLEDINQLQKG